MRENPSESAAASPGLRDRFRELLLRVRGRHFTPHHVIALYFNTVGLASRLNYPRYRWLTCWKPPLRLHLGCGPVYIPGWINIDGLLVWKTDVFLDIRAGLPFPNNSVEGIYTCHTLEHFEIGPMLGILREMHRVLIPGGGFRIVVPNLERAIDAYIALRAADQQHTAADGHAVRYADGRDIPCPSRHGHFESRGARFNWDTLCDNQHPVMFDFTFLSELLQTAGAWTDVQQTAALRSIFMTDKDLHVAEGGRIDYINDSLVVEGRKAETSHVPGT